MSLTTVAGRHAGARPSRALIVVGAAALFAWTIHAAGVRAVAESVTRLGGGFVLVLLLGGLRHLVRTIAWRRCMSDPTGAPLASAFAVWVAGNSLGNITPLGLLLSEPSKIVLLRARVPVGDAIAALTIENLCYAGTVVLVLAAGTVATFALFDVPDVLRLALAAIVVTAAGAVAVASRIVCARQPIVSRVVANLRDRGIGRGVLDAWPSQIRRVEDTVFAFMDAHASRLLPVLGLEAAYHVLAVAEIWFVVAAITEAPPSAFTAFVLEYVNRTITICFQFVPMWLGVDEAASALAASVLQLGATAGVTVALVRRARILCWTGVGLALGARRT